MSDDIELPDGPLRFVSAAVADDLRAERDALAARVKELEARIAVADAVLERAYGVRYVTEARRILRGDDTPKTS